MTSQDKTKLLGGEKLPGSLDVSSIGRQLNSTKETFPEYSFGTQSREVQTKKVFFSGGHEQRKGTMISPGPVYKTPSYLGEGPKHSFGTDDQRKHAWAKYPDSSVDLTCATVDSQRVKFPSTKGVHFGTEGRMNKRNGEIIRVHPGLVHGEDAQESLWNTPDMTKVTTRAPEYSFGPKGEIQSDGRVPRRLPLPLMASPRTLGPGSHTMPSAVGGQPLSARTSAPSWGFSRDQRSKSARGDRQLYDCGVDLSSMGRQVLAGAPSGPQHSFGTSTRTDRRKSVLIRHPDDLSPGERMPKLNFPIDLPPPQKRIAKVGM
mmetsp:Transcript_46334/g.91835  ORF Transcript_46334/g.91835 Transcript_46334/m.91835 type:complete len:317 (-) Transcript_46334:179-1129(-)|eukprot:CAMPEP_0172865768 /NCGR_PEP_ID=MMETSP1075-20121228/81600_1 /TAXON_ID=2916 /ORGANISM="Ceratium fusus, Strain PA161109" /LENGTH=316 /DNA_ID=CAMNT_0013714853 /DNA_START=40 /DNA_END=990 /DNA_ORIENTATION=+